MQRLVLIANLDLGTSRRVPDVFLFSLFINKDIFFLSLLFHIDIFRQIHVLLGVVHHFYHLRLEVYEIKSYDKAILSIPYKLNTHWSYKSL